MSMAAAAGLDEALGTDDGVGSEIGHWQVVHFEVRRLGWDLSSRSHPFACAVRIRRRQDAERERRSRSKDAKTGGAGQAFSGAGIF
jgi:hypothetical protein